jgi:hypothetical protein
VSPIFVNFIYLKFQLDLDTCYNMNAPCLLANVGYYCVYHVSSFVTSELRPSGEITCYKPFSPEVVSVEGSPCDLKILMF